MMVVVVVAAATAAATAAAAIMFCLSTTFGNFLSYHECHLLCHIVWGKFFSEKSELEFICVQDNCPT